MQIRLVVKEGLGRRGCLSSVGYELMPTLESRPVHWASVTYANNDPDGAVLALRRLAGQLEDRLDGMVHGVREEDLRDD